MVYCGDVKKLKGIVVHQKLKDLIIYTNNDADKLMRFIRFK